MLSMVYAKVRGLHDDEVLEKDIMPFGITAFVRGRKQVRARVNSVVFMFVIFEWL